MGQRVEEWPAEQRRKVAHIRSASASPCREDSKSAVLAVGMLQSGMLDREERIPAIQFEWGEKLHTRKDTHRRDGTCGQKDVQVLHMGSE